MYVVFVKYSYFFIRFSKTDQPAPHLEQQPVYQVQEQILVLKDHKMVINPACRSMEWNLPWPNPNNTGPYGTPNHSQL